MCGCFFFSFSFGVVAVVVVITAAAAVAAAFVVLSSLFFFPLGFYFTYYAWLGYLALPLPIFLYLCISHSFSLPVDVFQFIHATYKHTKMPVFIIAWQMYINCEYDAFYYLNVGLNILSSIFFLFAQKNIYIRTYPYAMHVCMCSEWIYMDVKCLNGVGGG